MHKTLLTAVSAVIIGGCATPPPPSPTTSTYTYESVAHSGTVTVTDKQYSTDAFTCPEGWREGEVYQPKGVPSPGAHNLKISIGLKGENGGDQSIAIVAPQSLGNKVLAKDYQHFKTFMLGTQKNGLVHQGDHFEYPEGYYVRISNPKVVGWSFISCIGIDHTYVLDADLQSSTNPPVYLDRVVIPFVMNKEGQPVTVTFGSHAPQTATIRVDPE